MSSKRGKLTAGKARERVASLEESISARQHRLDQLEARLERSESPDERLLTAKVRLERRLMLERDQLEKLQKILHRETARPEESGEYFGSEEIDDLHRSFEEVRQNMAQIQARIDSTELPRDLSVRLNSFEERVARREEADSELFSQVLTLQTALDQERQTVRRLSRRTREQDQNLDALREAVEDSVVATVDLAQRLEELEEVMSETSESRHSSISPSQVPHWTAEVEVLRELVEDARRSLNDLQKQVADSLAQASREREELREAQSDFLKRQAEVEAQNLASSQLLLEARQTLHQQGKAVSQAGRLLEESTVKPQSSFAPEGLLSDLLLRLERLEAEHEARPVAISEAGQEGPKPAVFAANGTARGKRVAMFGVRPGFPEPAPRRGVKAGALASAEPKAQ